MQFRLALCAVCYVLLVAVAAAVAPHRSAVFARAGLFDGSTSSSLILSPGDEVEVQLRVSDERVTGLGVTFKNRLAAPAVHVMIYALDESPANSLFAAESTFNVSSTHAEFSDIDLPVAKLADEIRVAVIPAEVMTTTFVYELDSIPESMYDGELYDLRPSNSSMNFKFMARIVNNTMGVWVTRRAPIPPFVLSLTVDGEEFLRFSDSSAPAGGIGVDEAIPDVAAHNESDIVFRVIFYEVARANVARLTITNAKSFVSGLIAKSDLPDMRQTEGREVELQFQYYNATNYVSCKILQTHPLKNLMLSVVDGNGNVIFREEERQVPFLPRRDAIQFGWYHVIPGEFSGDITGKDTLIFEVHYDRREQQHPMTLLNEWIEDNGGSTSGVKDAPAGRRHRHTHGRRSVVAARDFDEKDMIASVPYRLLLTDAIVEANEWVRRFADNSSIYRAQAAEFGLGDSSIHFMFMTFFSIVQPNSDIDGTNWRLYFDTLPREDPPLPNFFTDDELGVFSFSPVVLNHTRKINTLWEAEFVNLLAEAPWLAEHIDLPRYRTIRGHLESRIFNISGVLTMVPLMDFMNHDDDPSVRLTYDDDAQTITFDATRPLRAGDALTIDYGAGSKSKLEFFFQFGFAPQGCYDSAVVTFNDRGYLLTNKKDSRAELLAAIQKSVTGEEGDLDDLSSAESASVLGKLKALLTERLQALPTEIQPLPPAAAKNWHHESDPEHFLNAARAILESERTTLERHVAWAALS